MFLAIFARVPALASLLSLTFKLVTSAHSESESFDLTSLGQTDPIGNNTALTLSGNRSDDDDQHSDHSRNGHASSQDATSPRQECPTDPPVDCIVSDCDGSNYPPDPFICKSTSTTTINSVEVTLFGCQCCRFPHWWCDDELCEGDNDLQCHSEVQMGCPCLDSAEEPVFTPYSPDILPATPVSDLQENQEILTTPVGSLEDRVILLGVDGEIIEYRNQQVHIKKL